MKTIGYFLMICFFLAASASGQSTSVTWNLNADPGVSAVVGNVTGTSQTLSNMQINSYQNVVGSGSGSSQLTTITGGAWPAESAQNNYRYIEVRLSPLAGYRFTASQVSLYYGGKGGGNLKGNIAYSATDTAQTSFIRLNTSTLAVSSSAGSMQQLSYPISVTVDTGKSFILRIYPWYTSASTGKYLCLQNIVIQGTTQSLSGIAATVTTSAISNISGTTAVGGGIVTDSGTATVSMRGVCWSTSPNPYISDAHTSDGSGTGSFVSNITGLTPNTTYHVRAYAVNNVDVAYGEEVTFSTVTIAPIVTTLNVVYRGVNTVVVAGAVTQSGGAAVTARGICWGTAPQPTINDHVVNAGIDIGSFTCTLESLGAGTMYYYRTFATNSVGTSYGADSTFTTLSTAVSPVVITNNAAALGLNSASVTGSVSYDGGATVTQRGICWHTAENPTTDNNIVTAGSGMGLFGGVLSGLTPATTYYARAFAKSSWGVAYANQIMFTTLAIGDTLIVAKDGSGDFLSVSQAFKVIPNNSAARIVVYIKRGIYFEKDTLQNCSNVLIIGEDRDSTVIRYDDYSGRVVGGTTIGTSTSQTFWIRSSANDITFRNLTIQNISTVAQAVALNTQGDRIYLENCKILGFQDTYYTWGTGRSYLKNCLIQGSVDFIFGSGIAVFDNCTINVNRNNGTLTAAATGAGYKYGYVFRNCTLTNDAIGFDGNPITYFHLGRPWQNAPRTVFLYCYEPATLQGAGWLSWNVTPALYAEYQCSGPGYQPSARVAWSKQLNDEEASAYTLAQIFAKTSASPNYASDWYPNDGLLPVEISAFHAEAIEREVRIAWITASEKNTAKFVIERTFESSAWLAVGSVTASGNSSIGRKYEFADRNLQAGKYQYRLKTVDFDGSYSLSVSIQANISRPVRMELLQNYPNPFNPVTTIVYYIPEDSRIVLSIFSVNGEKLSELLNRELQAGYHEYQIDAARLGLASGIYMYELKSLGLSNGNFAQKRLKMVYLK